jgi:hypothetical protein
MLFKVKKLGFIHLSLRNQLLESSRNLQSTYLVLTNPKIVLNCIYRSTFFVFGFLNREEPVT